MINRSSENIFGTRTMPAGAYGVFTFLMLVSLFSLSLLLFPRVALAQQGMALTSSGSIAIQGSKLSTQAVKHSYGPDNYLTIALDPGHGGSENGAVSYVIEKDVNWKIAEYCKAKLVQYPGVRVVITHAKDETASLEQRTYRALAGGTDILISLHNNAQDDNTIGGSGYQVYYQHPGSSYNQSSTSTPSRAVAASIASRLRSAGVNPQNPADNGLMTRISSGDYYPDGSLSDYYAMLRNPRLNNMPAVLVEHMYVDNASDGAKLNDENWLMKLGIADAEGIMDYFGYADEEWANAYDADTTERMYRLYNPNSGEHFYTSSENERNSVARAGWIYEGLGWVAPKSSVAPIYRLYNKYAGDHHYTSSAAERDALIQLGWLDEGVGWYSDDAKKFSVYRQYNPYAKTGSHNFTTSSAERDALVKVGWRDEGTAWFAVGAA